MNPYNKIYIQSAAIKIKQPVPGDYYTRHTGIICKKEWQFEKHVKIPVKLRLGSLEYTNWMERKPNALLR